MRIDILIGVAKKGGVENVINLTAPYLVSRGHDVRIVQVVFEGDLWADETIPFYPLLHGREGHTLTDFSDAYQDFLSTGPGKGAAPDLVLACAWPYMTWIARNVAVNLGLTFQVVSWLHNPVQRYIDAGYGGYDALRFADAHLAISRDISDSIRNNVVGSTIYRINNPVVFPAENTGDAADDRPLSDRRMLYYVGRLSDVKRADLIVEALALSHTSYELTVIGDGNGNEREELAALAKRKGIGERVHLRGWLEDAWSHVTEARALVMASVYEGFPLVAIEALAGGIPVISTPVEGITELIRPGVNGYLYPFGDTQALAKIFDAMEDHLFPEINPNVCRASVRAFEQTLALRDLSAKLRSIHTDRVQFPALPKQIDRILYAAGKISVIVPCYNAASFIGACLDSILAQTYPQDLMEIIVVNDASTDDTLQILHDYETRYPDRILLISYEENRGQGYARNTALSYAGGDYIAFVDADDTVDPAMFATLYEKAALYDVDFTVCGYALMTGEETVRTEEVPEQYYDLRDVPTKKRFILEQGCKNSPCTKLYRSSFLKEHDIAFPVNIKMEDVWFHELCMMHATRVFSVGQNLYRYRLNENGTMFSPRLKDYFLDTFTVQTAVYERMKEEGLTDGYEDELAVIGYVKGYVEPMGHMLDEDMGITYDMETAALLKETLLKLFPDIADNPYIHQDRSEYNQRFLRLLRE